MRDSWRSLTRSRGLTVTIVLSLALGTGANAAVYSAIDALLFRPPAGVGEPAALADVFTSQINGATYGFSSYADYLSLAGTAGIDAAAAVEDRDERAVRFGDHAGAPRIAGVTPGFWDLLRLTPHAGAWAAGGAVLSFDLWRRFGSDPAIVGKDVQIDGRAYRVGAIAPPAFRGLHLDRVQASLTSLAASLARQYPDTNLGTLRTADEPRRFTALRYSRLDPSVRWRTTLLAAALMGATLLMLVSACVNTGSLLLSRGMARRTELTIKLALGADRGRLIRQLLLESVLLSGAGAVMGVLVAAWSAGAIPALFAPDHARLLDTRVDPRVIAATLGAGLLTGVLCGLAPALLSTRALAPGALRGDASRIGERPGGARLRMTLVGAQLALSTIFLIASALLSTVVDTALGSQRAGAAGEVTVAAIESYDSDYRSKVDAELRRTPGVDVVGWVTTAPLGRAVQRTYVISRGPAVEPVDIDINYATRDYFRVMYMPVIEGRAFTPADGTGEHDDVAIINDALAQRYFAGTAVGRSLTTADGRSVEIVGVVRTRAYRAFEGAPAPMVFLPMTRTRARAFTAVVRSRDPRAVAKMRAALARAGTPRHLEVLAFDAYLSRALAPDRLIARLAGACGLASLALALVGVYGVLGDMVRRRTRDIGLRLALGASPRQVLQGVLGAGLVPACAGIVAGVGGAEAAIRLARSFVYELPVLDAGLAAGIVALLLAVVAAAVAPPAVRAIRVNPAIVLRS